MSPGTKPFCRFCFDRCLELSSQKLTVDGFHKLSIRNWLTTKSVGTQNASSDPTGLPTPPHPSTPWVGERCGSQLPATTYFSSVQEGRKCHLYLGSSCFLHSGGCSLPPILPAQAHSLQEGRTVPNLTDWLTLVQWCRPAWRSLFLFASQQSIRVLGRGRGCRTVHLWRCLILLTLEAVIAVDHLYGDLSLWVYDTDSSLLSSISSGVPCPKILVAPVKP